MKIYLFPEQLAVRVKIGEEWKDLGTAIQSMTAKGTPYYEMDIDDDTLVDKLRDIDWIAKGEKPAQFVGEVEEKKFQDY